MKKTLFYLLANASLFLASCATQNQLPPVIQKQPEQVFDGPRQPVENIVGIVLLHPDSIVYTGIDDRKYWLYADPTNGYLFVTENSALYTVFSDHLPVALQVTAPAVVLGGVTIDPLTIFRPDQMQKIATSQNMTLVELNHYKMAKIFGYGTANNLSEAIKALDDLVKKADGIKNQSATKVLQTSHPSTSSAPNTNKQEKVNYDPSKAL